MNFKDFGRKVSGYRPGAQQKAPKWMTGRYGVDQLGRAMLIVSLVCVVVSLIPQLKNFLILGIVLLVVCYWRMLSKNSSKRYQENIRYLGYSRRVRRWWNGLKTQASRRKANHYYKCPSCKEKMRVPRGKGRVRIVCPKCKTEFYKKA